MPLDIFMNEETLNSHTEMMTKPLGLVDAEVFSIIKKEKHRQTYGLELIASENFASRAVLEAIGSCMNNKYSEGYPGQRYYGGVEYVDQMELLCQKRALEVFGLDPEKWGVNVQSYSGSPANIAILTAIAGIHGRIMGLDLPDGGHLTHGYKNDKRNVSMTSTFFESMAYKVNPETGLIDYDKLEENAQLFRPKVIISGASCYPRFIDYGRIRMIADKVGAYHISDISQLGGMQSAGQMPSAFDHCDVLMSTTHKTLRGARAAIIFYRKGVRSVDAKGKEIMYELETMINQTVFPGLQGGPHNNTIAGVAVALKEAMTPEFKAYQKQVLINCQVLVKELIKHGYKLVSGGSDNHICLVDVLDKGIDGARAQVVLDACAIACNKNSVGGDKDIWRPRAVRFGTPALSSRGLLEEDFKKVAEFIHKGLSLAVEIQNSVGPKCTLKKFKEFVYQGEPFKQKIVELRAEVEYFGGRFPMPGMAEL